MAQEGQASLGTEVLPSSQGSEPSLGDPAPHPASPADFVLGGKV